MDKNIMRTRNENARRYEQSSRVHRNCVRINANNTLRHELSKFIIGYILRKGGDVRIIFPILMDYIDSFCNQLEVSQALENWCFNGSEREFITEAVTNNRKDRDDIIILDSGERIEVDCEHGNVKELETKGKIVFAFNEKEKHDTKNWFKVT